MNRIYANSDREEIRHDWSVAEIRAIHDGPLLDLVFRAAAIHRRYNDPADIQRAPLLSIKTGGCPEDCGYCSQSASADSGLKATRLMDVDAVLAVVRSRLRGHGGDVAVRDVRDGVVDLEFQGACRGCPAQAFTHVAVLEASLADVDGVARVTSSRSHIAPAVVQRIRSTLRRQRSAPPSIAESSTNSVMTDSPSVQ